MACRSLLLLVAIAGACAFDKFPKQFVFELPDNEDFCFFETFDKEAATEQYTISFRVERGGNNDIDFVITSPDQNKVYEKQREHHAEYQTTFQPGTYSFCFGNQFSTITHKLIFFSLNRNRPESLAEEAGATKTPTAMSQMQASMENLHQFLANVEMLQTWHRARESSDLLLGDDLNSRVFIFSLGLAIAVLVCGVGQVLVLKTFFSDKKNREWPRYSMTKT